MITPPEHWNENNLTAAIDKRGKEYEAEIREWHAAYYADKAEKPALVEPCLAAFLKATAGTLWGNRELIARWFYFAAGWEARKIEELRAVYGG